MLAPGHLEGDEVWQLSKDSADAATACSFILLMDFNEQCESSERNEKAESTP